MRDPLYSPPALDLETGGAGARLDPAGAADGREHVAALLWQEVCRLTSDSPSAIAEEDRLLSQVVSSSGFLRLLLGMEGALGIVVDDEDLYDAAPVTLGDLIDFLAAKAARGKAG